MSIVSETREKVTIPNNSLLTVVFVLAALYFGREVFVPLALAALLSFLLVPASGLLERLGLRRAFAAILVVLLALAAIATLGWIMLAQIYTLAIELPQYQQNITQKIGSLNLHSAGRLSSTVAMLSEESRQLRGGTPVLTPPGLSDAPKPRGKSRSKSAADLDKNQLSVQSDQPVAVRVEAPEESVVNLVNRSITPLIHPIATTFVVVVFLGFMLVGREDLRDRGIRLAGRGRMQVTTSAIEDASCRVGRYLRMQLIVNVTFGVIAGFCLWGIGVPNPLLWAILICLLRFVPYIGIFLAAAGPLLLSIAVSPQWSLLLWTATMFLLLELVASNVVEPLLYSSSTGLSPIAVLIAAIFWTLLWGLPGLLLSTPLTVCLVVIGRQVPRFQYLDILLGDETALPPSERFYQRLLSSNIHEARNLLDGLLSVRSREQVYDAVVIPALTLIEESRHGEEITASRAEEMLHAIDELTEDMASRESVSGSSGSTTPKLIICIPARDLADEVVCHFATHILTPAATVHVVPAETAPSAIAEMIERLHPDAICIVGIPPQSLRYIRLRCHQVRSRFPDAVLFACLLSEQCDLSNIRSRIPTEHSQHVVCSLQLMKEYLLSLLYSTALEVDATRESGGATDAKEDLTDPVLAMQRAGAIDETEEGAFQRLTTNLARSFDAPISILSTSNNNRSFWEAYCGLPNDALLGSDASHDPSILTRMIMSESILVVPDISEDPLYIHEPFLSERGIRFYAGTPIKSHDDAVIGSLCVLDTRPRQITEKQKEMLLWIAEVVMTAIELQKTTAPIDTSLVDTELSRVEG